MDRNDEDGIRAVIKQLFGKSATPVVRPPFYCGYGTHIEAGKNFFANYNALLLDVGRMVTGDQYHIILPPYYFFLCRHLKSCIFSPHVFAFRLHSAYTLFVLCAVPKGFFRTP